MADQKVSDLPSLNGADVDAADLLYIVDSSAGTAGSKKITVGQYQLAPYSAGTANGVMYLNGSNVVTTSSGLVFDGTNFATTGTASATKLIPTGGSATGNGMYLPAANTLAWSNNGAETMRLDSSGNLLVGTASAAGRLTVEGSQAAAGTLNALTLRNSSDGGVGLYFDNSTSNNLASIEALVTSTGAGSDDGILAFSTATNGTNTERARIDSSGNLLRGQTISGNQNSRGFYSDTAGYFGQNHLNTDASGSFYAYFGYNGGTIGSITQSGTTAVLYNTTSDQRLKTNIVDAPDASALIDAIQVRSFDWISDNSHQRYGMVAQELAQVAPEAVHQPIDPDEMMAVDYSKLVPMLIKEIQSLRARVAALEAQ